MKLVLTVEGKEYSVCAVYFREGKVNSVDIFDENGVIVTYYDTKEKTIYYVEKPLRIDFDTCLKWEGRYAGVEELIRKRIEAHEERLNELSNEFMLFHMNKNIAFPEIEAKAIKDEYEEIYTTLNGLYESLNIVHELEGV